MTRSSSTGQLPVGWNISDCTIEIHALAWNLETANWDRVWVKKIALIDVRPRLHR